MTRDEMIDEIIALEWGMFTTAHNNGGRASCQDDWSTFQIMRRSQHMIWSMDTLASYKSDLITARGSGLNLIAFKYGYMMRVTFPDEYEQIKKQLPPISPEKKELVDAICACHAEWSKKEAEKYPYVASMGRPRTAADAGGSRWASVDNYLYSELLTYSEQTLAFCLRDTRSAQERGENMSIKIVENTAHLYGYPGLDELEARLRGAEKKTTE